ncbi:MAG TPA: hypothetical protein VK555_08060, partial [Terriglobales bacterium]|nr:hypothetical protein [Terriglobales bacterium]
QGRAAGRRWRRDRLRMPTMIATLFTTARHEATLQGAAQRNHHAQWPQARKYRRDLSGRIANRPVTLGCLF